MKLKIFHSKTLTIFTLLLFLILLSSDVLPERNVPIQRDVDRLVREGKELYENGEYEEAKDKFLEALGHARERKGLSDVYFCLSLAYYANGQSGKAKEYLLKLFETQADSVINELLCPSKFVEMFNNAKVESLKLKEREKKPVVKTKPAIERKVIKGGGGVLPGLGVLVVVGGGIAAALLLSKKESTAPTTGSIQVNSVPTEAEVWLDNNNTGQTTNCTLTGLSAGYHYVKLVKEGYENEQSSVSVTAGQTATVNVTLTKHTITVIEIPPGTVWTNGKEIEIKWQVSGSAGVSTGAGLDPLIQHGRNVLNPFQRRAFQDRNSQDSETRERGELENSGTTEKFVILSGKQSKLQDISKKLPSSARAGDIFNRRAKDIRDIRRKSRVGITNIPVVPQISNGKLMPSGDIRVLALSNVKIDLYKGSTFNQTIVSSTDNDGSYMWIVDSSLLDGTDYKVRISSTSDSSIYGESETFTIEEKSITVTEPTSDTDWIKGFQTDITWDYKGTIENVKIELYKGDNPDPVKEIVSSTACADKSDTWDEVDTSLEDGTDYKVRISSTSDSTSYGESEAFRIADKSITVSKPESSTTWTKGFSATVEWDYMGIIDNVKIDLYKGGTFNQTIKDSTPAADKAYSWDPVDPNLEDGTDYTVRISLVDTLDVYDDSEEFKIEEKSITVSKPESSTTWTKGFSATVEWDYMGIIDNVKIDLYKGGTFNQTIKDSTPAADKSYPWDPVDPNLEDGTDYTVRISLVDTLDVYDDSEEFKIEEEQSITVNSPNGDESWGLDSTKEITWTSHGNVSNSLKIDLYKGGSFYADIVDETANDGTHDWTIPDTIAEGSDYRVRITDKNNALVWDESDADFALVVTSITVNSPNGGESWDLGSTQQIEWIALGEVSNAINIDLYKGGTHQESIVDGTDNNGSYDWNIPDTLPVGSDYTVIITDANKPALSDESDADFALVVTSITVASPNGGEKWGWGMDYQIKWTSQGNVSNALIIDLYKGDSFHDNIRDGTPNDGEANWSVSDSYPEGSDYRIRITDKSNTSKWDESDNYFSILEEAISKPSTPNGPNNGEVNENIDFSTSSSSNLGHSLEYRFNWGDGIIGNWGSATQSHKWSDTGTFSVKAQARCIEHPTSYSTWSNTASISIDPIIWSQYTSKDSYIYSGNPGSNFGNEEYLFVGGGLHADRTLIDFDIASNIPAEATIVEATLRVYATGTSNAPFNIRIGWITGLWTELGVKWNFAPGSMSFGTEHAIPSGSGYLYFDVKDEVQYMLDNGFDEGFMIIKIGETVSAYVTLSSSENTISSFRAPMLLVKYIL